MAASRAFFPVAQGGIAQAADDLEWVEYLTDEGKPYYFNKNTKITSWTKPDHYKPAPTPQAAASANARGSWKEFKDPTGKSYYFNAETKETTWTRPAALDDNLAAVAATTHGIAASTIPRASTSTAASDMEKAMEATLRIMPSETASRVPIETTDPNEQKQRQAEVFRELLLDKYRTERIKTSMSWDNAIRHIQQDPRFVIIGKVSEKKRIFNEWKAQQQKDERESRRLAVRKSKEELEQLLLNSRRVKPNTPYSKLDRWFGREEAWTSLGESEKKDIIKDTMILIRRKREDEAKQKRKDMLQQIVDILESLSDLSYKTPWLDALKQLQESAAFKENSKLSMLHKLDLLDGFREFMRKAEKEHTKEVEALAKRRRREERKIRDAFQELLLELNANGTINSASTWIKTYPLFRQDSRFEKMLNQPGSTPLDMFKFYVDDLKTQYNKDRRRIREILEKLDREVGAETTFEDFERWIRSEDPNAEIDRVNLQHRFSALVEKATRKRHDSDGKKEKKSKKDKKKKERRRKEEGSRKRKHSRSSDDGSEASD